MRDDVRITPVKGKSWIRRISFEVSTEYAEAFIRDLRLMSNCRYGVSRNPRNMHPVPTFAIVVTAVSMSRKEDESYVTKRFEDGDVEGLS